MSESDIAYKYTIPLDKSGDGDSPLYDSSGNGEVLMKHYTPNTLIMIQTEASPHFHKDDVNVTVEEVEADEYR